MNYRHAFHAGNFADVLKHAALALCLDRLNVKAKPYRFIDTHAGVGLYDFSGEEAERSPEWREGVGRIWSQAADAPADVQAALEPYLQTLQRLNPNGALRYYPGSPVLAAEMIRTVDALRLCELHPETAERLAEVIGRDRRVKIEMRDGFEALGAYLPPPERRGLVLIDPPFEEGVAARKLDFERMARATLRAVRRWPQGTYILWRPLKDLDAVEAFDAQIATDLIELEGLAPEKLLVADLWVRPIAPGPLAGAGVLIVNPPFGLSAHLQALLPWLAATLDQSEAGNPGAGWRLNAPSAADEDEPYSA